jgi:NADH:ubiquinone oxidoreductase subunit 6 (subunit J)
LLFRFHKRIPFRPSTLEDFRLGNYYDNNLPTLPAYFWYAVTIIGIIGACSVVFALIVGITKTDEAALPDLDKRRLRLLLLSLIIYLAPVFLVHDYWDRYVLPAIPITLLALFLITNQGNSGQGRSTTTTMQAPKPAVAASFILLAGLAMFSVLGTRDYLSYYRAAWIARQFEVSHGVPPDLAFNVPNWGPAYFDGGYLNDAEMFMNGPVPHADSGYDIGTGVKPGYHVIKEFPVQLMLNQREITMFVSKRN